MRQKRAEEILKVVGDVSGLAQMFFEAADTERRMPPGHQRLSIKSCWPEYPPDQNLAYGYHDAEVRLTRASPGAINRYDLALEAGILLEIEDRKIVWAAAHSSVRRQRGPAWKRIAKMLHMHPQTARRKFQRAILELWYKLITLVDNANENR